MLGQCGADLITIVGLVHNRMGQPVRVGQLGQHGVKYRTLMPLPFGKHERYTDLCIDTAGMDFGGQTAPRAAQSLCGLPAVFFNAPAAC